MITTVGTPLYMSPQLLQQNTYTSKSDIWSLGVIFYEMLYNKTPWIAGSPQGLLKNIKTIPLKFPENVIVSD